ncbi:hypothetical protein D3C75_720790 [compost metagenome]
MLMLGSRSLLSLLCLFSRISYRVFLLLPGRLGFTAADSAQRKHAGDIDRAHRKQVNIEILDLHPYVIKRADPCQRNCDFYGNRMLQTLGPVIFSAVEPG